MEESPEARAIRLERLAKLVDSWPIRIIDFVWCTVEWGQHWIRRSTRAVRRGFRGGQTSPQRRLSVVLRAER